MALLVADQPTRCAISRCVARRGDDGGGAHAHNDAPDDALPGKPHFFGDAVPAELSSRFTPVICRVSPQRALRVEDGGGRLLARLRWLCLAPWAAAPYPPRMPGCSAARSLPCSSHSCPAATPGEPGLVRLDGEDVLISTTLERQKGRTWPPIRVALPAIDPANNSRYVEVRGTVAEIAQAGAIDLADRLTQRYTGKGDSTATSIRPSSGSEKHGLSVASARQQ